MITRELEPRESRPTILIVDDHDVLLNSLQAWISQQFPDREVLAVENGEDAVRVAHDRLPGIVIMDLMLPNMSGMEAIAHIKAFLPTAGVIAITAQDADEFRRGATQAGADAFVHKAELHRKLLPAINYLLDRPVA